MSLPEWISKRISALTRTATSGTLTDGEFMAVDDENAYTRKITVAALAEWVIGKWQAFVNGSPAATEADLVAGSKLPVMTANGPKSLPGNTIAKASEQAALTTYAQNVAHSIAPEFDPTRTSDNAYKVGEDVVYGGKRYILKSPHYGAWSSSDVQEIPIDTDNLALFPYRVYSGGYVLDSLNNALDNRVYFIQRSASLTTTNFPADAPTDATFIFVSLKVNSSSSQYQREQRLVEVDNGNSWSRQYNHISNAWTSWLRDGCLNVTHNQIFAGWNKNLASLNDAAVDSILHLTVNASTSTANIPSDFRVGAATDGTLLTVKTYYDTSSYRIYQTLIRESDGMIWTRYYQGNWTAWAAKKYDYITLEENEIFHTSSTNPASLNDLVNTKIVRVWRDSSVATTNFPSDYPVDAKGTLSVYKAYSTKSANQYQIFQTLTLDGSINIWTRYYNSIESSWTSWIKAEPQNDTIIIGPGQTYTTLRAGLAAAYAKQNAEVLIMPGEYNCVTEWSTEMHAVTVDTGTFGNWIGNGMHVVAMPGAKIKAMLSRSDFLDLSDAQWARLATYFEPMGSRNGSFTVENLDIESQNTRYCFHDDYGSSACVRKFINCRMLRHTTNATAVKNPLVACIGGGLSPKETVVIDGGWYKSEPSAGNLDIMNGDVNYAQVPISYHQNSGSNCEASITIKNIYLADKGFFGFYYYGTTAEKCKVLISGCRSKYPPLLCRCTTGSEVVNFDVIPFCNEFEEAENGHWESDTTGPLNSTWVLD